jgi:hypothetical protein
MLLLAEVAASSDNNSTWIVGVDRIDNKGAIDHE